MPFYTSSLSSHELRTQCKEYDFEEKGLNYFVVAVLGCQSTGKSVDIRHSHLCLRYTIEHVVWNGI
jgi:hypothetical protein